VSNAEFIEQCRGVSAEEPEGPPEVDDAERRACRDATQRHLDGSDVSYRGGVAWPIGREIGDATRNAIDRRLDELFAKSEMAPFRQEARKSLEKLSERPLTFRQLARESVSLERKGLSPDAALGSVMRRHGLKRLPGLRTGPPSPSRSAASPPLTLPTIPSPSSRRRVASDDAHRKIDQQMDEAFVKNVAKNRKLQAEAKAARKT